MLEVSHNNDERRSSFRLDMEKELIDIEWSDTKGVVNQKRIACINFSRGGLKIECDQAIELKAQVTIIFKAASPNHQKLHGYVLRCLKQSNGSFEIALRILND